MSSLDEITTRYEGYSVVGTYIPSKPAEFRTRLHAVVEWLNLYLHSINDSGSGNCDELSPMQIFLNMFRGLCGCLENDFVEHKFEA